jgi:hypothetical protein
MTVAAQTGERKTMLFNLAEHRLNRQLRSASAATTDPGLQKTAPLHAAVVLTWWKVSPSAHLMVDPRNGARAVIRDTGADAGRYLWSVLAAGTMDPMSEGRTEDLARAQALAEAALRAYAEKRVEDPTGMPAMWHEPKTNPPNSRDPKPR